jgi:hypothetical protein
VHGHTIDVNTYDVSVTSCYLESSRVAPLFITTGNSVSVANSKLVNTNDNHIIQFGYQEGIIIKKVTVEGNMYEYVGASPTLYRPSNLAAFDGWDSEVRLDEEIGWAVTLTDPALEYDGNVINVNLPLKRFKAYHGEHDITGISPIIKPLQSDMSVFASAGCDIVGRSPNSLKPILNINVGFGQYITKKYRNTGSAYGDDYGLTSGDVKLVFY